MRVGKYIIRYTSIEGDSSSELDFVRFYFTIYMYMIYEQSILITLNMLCIFLFFLILLLPLMEVTDCETLGLFKTSDLIGLQFL